MDSRDDLVLDLVEVRGESLELGIEVGNSFGRCIIEEAWPEELISNLLLAWRLSDLF